MNRCAGALTPTEGLNASQLFWENEMTPQHAWVGGQTGVGAETSFAISKVGATGPFGTAAYLQAHLPSTQQEYDQVNRAWSEHQSLVVEELSCFAPVSGIPCQFEASLQ